MKISSALSIFSIYLSAEVSGAHTALRPRIIDFERKVGVTLAVNLPGLSTFKKPDENDLAFAESALMKAYNQVYKGTDFAMLDVHVSSPFTTGTRGLGKQVGAVGPDGLSLPHDDDDRLLVEVKVGPYNDAEENLEFLMFTEIGCNRCLNDFEFGDELGAAPGLAKLKSVENSFCRVLSEESNGLYYSELHDCSVTVHLDVDDASTVEFDMTDVEVDLAEYDHQFSVTLGINFPGLSSKNPNGRDLAVAETALMKAYNQVFKGTNFAMIDDHVENVGPSDYFVENLQGRHSDWDMYTMIGCWLCKEDDAMFDSMGGGSLVPYSDGYANAKLKMVEKLMCRVLVEESNDPYFRSVHDCSLTVQKIETPVVAVDGKTTAMMG